MLKVKDCDYCKGHGYVGSGSPNDPVERCHSCRKEEEARAKRKILDDLFFNEGLEQAAEAVARMANDEEMWGYLELCALQDAIAVIRGLKIKVTK